MYRTLSELKSLVDCLIEQQGENATCVSFIYTKEDVFYFDDIQDDEIYLPLDDTNQVLEEVGNTDYIYQQIGELIDDEVGRVRNQINT
tara:strand:- start:417 stop:680 length:264 start_codon:yes stop_codon:yes gene_type:complete